MPAARPGIGMPGGMLTGSCNRADPGTGVLWALHPVEGDANHATVAGMVQAYRAVRSVQSVPAVVLLLWGVCARRYAIRANISDPRLARGFEAFNDRHRNRGRWRLLGWNTASDHEAVDDCQLGSDDTVLFEHGDLGTRQSEPLAVNLAVVLAELRAGRGVDRVGAGDAQRRRR